MANPYAISTVDIDLREAQQEIELERNIKATRQAVQRIQQKIDEGDAEWARRRAVFVESIQEYENYIQEDEAKLNQMRMNHSFRKQGFMG